MNTRQQLLNLDSAALQQLLKVGLEFCDDRRDDDGPSFSHVERLLGMPCPVMIPGRSERTTLEVLLDESQPLSLYVQLKDHFKTGIASRQFDENDDAAKVPYYAAIAAAVVYHRRIITTLDVKEFGDALMYLGSSTGIPFVLADLFRQASVRIRDERSLMMRGTAP